MLRSWKLGSLFGIGIYIHWSFILILGFVLYSNWTLGGPPMALYGVGLVLALFGCVLLHELGHALTARRFGISTRDITLYMIGGVARLERMSERPLEEFLIAIAGPAVNVVIAGILLPLVLLGNGGVVLGLAESATFANHHFLLDLLSINSWLVAFNLLPAFPMDGGRVLRALLTGPFGRLRATEIAAHLGVGFAVVFAVLGFWANPMLLLVGAFIFLAGQQELAMVRWREANRRAEPVDVLPAGDDVLDAQPVAPRPGFSGATWDPTARVWVLWSHGQPIHTIRGD